MKRIEDSYSPEDRERDLAALLFLRQQISAISGKDFDSEHLLLTGHQRHKRVLTPEQINSLIFDLNDAIEAVKAGFPLSLHGQSIESLTERVNDLRKILIKHDILGKKETL